MFQDMKKAMKRDAACMKGRVRSAKMASQDKELELESLQRDLACYRARTRSADFLRMDNQLELESLRRQVDSYRSRTRATECYTFDQKQVVLTLTPATRLSLCASLPKNLNICSPMRSNVEF